MNSRGEAIFGLMVWVMLIVLAIAMQPSIKEVVEDARGVNFLDCSNGSITTGTAATFLVIDLFQPYFLITIFLAGASYFAYRFYSGG